MAKPDMRILAFIFLTFLSFPAMSVFPGDHAKKASLDCPLRLAEVHPDIFSTWVRANRAWPQMDLGIAYSLLSTLTRLGAHEEEKFLNLPLSERQLNDLLQAMDRAHGAYKIDPIVFRGESIDFKRNWLQKLWSEGKAFFLVESMSEIPMDASRRLFMKIAEDRRPISKIKDLLDGPAMVELSAQYRSEISDAVAKSLSSDEREWITNRYRAKITAAIEALGVVPHPGEG
jgi:hypothetical protein